MWSVSTNLVLMDDLRLSSTALPPGMLKQKVLEAQVKFYR